MKTSNTKKRFVLSLIAVIACVAMLVGTTMAWFTDSVTSGKNRIVAGNLDVELKHYTTDAASATTVQDATNLFNVALWEPGVVAYENFIVSNEGNLALKYALNLSIAKKNAVSGTNKDLSDVIKVAVVDGGFTGDRAATQALSEYQTLADFQKTGNLTAKENGHASDTYGVVLYWEPTDHDNDYNLNNGKTSTDGQPLFIEFGVNLVATQDTVEADSFNNQYDLSAQLPVVASFPSITQKDIDDNKTITIKEKGAIKEASVPAKGAETIFDELKKTDDGLSNDLTLTLHVDETSKKEEGDLNKSLNLNLDISMDASMVVTRTATGEVVENKVQKVESLDDFTVLNMEFGKGYTSVNVKHRGEQMDKLASAAAPVSDEKASIGGFYYDKASGIITLKMKSFSPFEIEAVRDHTFYVGENGYETLQAAFDAVKASARGSAQTIKLAKDYTMTSNASLNDYNGDWLKHKVTLDLGGHTISASVSSSFQSSPHNYKCLIYVRGDGTTFTLKNGKIICDDSNLNCEYSVFRVDRNNATIKDVNIESFGSGIYVSGSTTINELNATITSYLPNNTNKRSYSNVAPIYCQGIITKISGGTYSLLDKAMENENYMSTSVSTNAALLAYGSSAKINEIDGATFVSCAGIGNGEAGIVSVTQGASIATIKNTTMRFASTRANREFRCPFALGNSASKGTIGAMNNVTFALGRSLSYGYSFDTQYGCKKTVEEALEIFNTTFTNCEAVKTNETQTVSYNTSATNVVEVELPIISVTAK